MSQRRGVALVLVLWVITVLGAIAAGVAAATHSESTLTVNVRSRTVARYASESGVEAGVAQLDQLLRQTQTMQDRVQAFAHLNESFEGLHDIDVGGGRFTVTVVDISARVDVNSSSDETMRALLARFAGERRAESLVAALRDWTDADDRPRPSGAEADEYRRMRSAFVPTNSPLESIDELTHVLGFDVELVSALAPYISVNGGNRINVNTAPEIVLASVRDVGEAAARRLIARRDGDGIFTSMSALSTAMSGAFGPTALLQLDVLPARLMIVSRGWQPGHPLTHEIRAVYELGNAGFVLRAWTERDL